MTTVISTPTLIETPVTKQPNVTAPAIEIISDEKLSSNFVPTGISVIIPTNLAKVNSEALFACNVDGFIPFLNPTSSASSLFKNFMPVQVTETGNNIAGLRVIYQYCDIPVQFKYLSFRYFTGNVKIAVRMVSQTGQTGNFVVTQLRSGSRVYYASTEAYKGVRFSNASVSSLDYAPSSFAISDLSLNRNVSITPCRTNPLVYQDHARKIYDVYRYGNGANNYDNYSVMINQHSEDWLLFEPIFNLSGSSSSEIVMSFLFDFSDVSFFVPMYPVRPMYPRDYNLQILLYTTSFKDQVGSEDYREWKWYPRDVASILPKDYPPERFGEYAVGGAFKIDTTSYTNKFISHIKAVKGNLDYILHPFFRHFSRLWKTQSSPVTTTTPSS